MNLFIFPLLFCSSTGGPRKERLACKSFSLLDLLNENKKRSYYTIIHTKGGVLGRLEGRKEDGCYALF
jgi:hypothetical protein